MTALLREKGTDDAKPFDKTVWFSDTYIRTPAGLALRFRSILVARA